MTSTPCSSNALTQTVVSDLRSSSPVTSSTVSAGGCAASPASARCDSTSGVELNLSSIRRRDGEQREVGRVAQQLVPVKAALDEMDLAVGVAGRTRSLADGHGRLGYEQWLDTGDQVGAAQAACESRRQGVRGRPHSPVWLMRTAVGQCGLVVCSACGPIMPP